MGLCCGSPISSPSPLTLPTDPTLNTRSGEDSDEGVDTNWKILLLGERYTGRSSLSARFIDHVFQDPPVPSKKAYKSYFLTGEEWFGGELKASKTKVEIWDPKVPGQGMYRGAHAVVIVCDCSNRASFEKMDFWTSQVEEYKPLGDLPKAVVGLKSDVESHVVSDDDLKQWTEKWDEKLKSKVKWIVRKVSAKDNVGVDELFSDIVQTIKTASRNSSGSE